ncbi:hypothetical protein N7492_000153 [Penicillium capsulatum]|uniref:Uncharacterized protein n=1 Tax=Penicillium capsulatum TaxID=69766 RepID=A0A9W9IR94_9EURO|nr:hypothetical protein N7492_000153 [Penicillium capsulatum]KAJ6130782.1 hypothetical protein N7512_003562 [Penicillium capsulatum]
MWMLSLFTLFTGLALAAPADMVDGVHVPEDIMRCRPPYAECLRVRSMALFSQSVHADRTRDVLPATKENNVPG